MRHYRDTFNSERPLFHAKSRSARPLLWTFLVNASRFLLWVALTTATGCVVSPQPSPPILEGDRIGLVQDTGISFSSVGFVAGPGTVAPARGVVIVTNLDQSDAPSIAAVAPDGSFTIAVSGVPGQRFRFQAKDGSTRSEPFDALVGASGETVAADATDPACLVVTPALWASLGGAGDTVSIALENRCTGAFTLAAPRLRRGLAGFSTAQATPIALAGSATATFTVSAGSGPEVEDVLFLDATAPASLPAIRAITLTVPDL